ncbi:MAG: hypothetical protein IPM30_11775 [Burkholderiales bacterium]|nr:hypothetical protein [Burkholderiales bacterium]
MKRRTLLLAAATAPAAALAHHGWSSFDQDRPVYLEGRIKSVRWANPHAEAVITVDASLKLPADLGRRSVPAQSQNVDGAAVLAKTRLPEAAGGDWTIEFAPLSRMNAWGVREPKPGERIEVVGYIAPKIGNGRLLRVEYLFADGKAYGLRSSPAG